MATNCGDTYHVRHLDGVAEEAGIRGNDLEGKFGIRALSQGEVESKRPRNGCVEEAEAILSWLDIQKWPGLSILINPTVSFPNIPMGRCRKAGSTMLGACS